MKLTQSGNYRYGNMETNTPVTPVKKPRYIIHRKIAKGGYGTLYLVSVDDGSNKEYVLKEIVNKHKDSVGIPANVINEIDVMNCVKSQYIMRYDKIQTLRVNKSTIN